ncbi:MAG: hypothetical protein Q4G43_03680 [Mobilicoccus sp.]|nr:hypothetical protein [Mobilicoccus sp.]
MSRWEPGRAEVESLLAAGHLERIAPSLDNAARLMAEAERHLGSASTLADDDPAGAYDMLYSAARKAMSAALAVQGLRATSAGGHVAVQEAVTAQLGRQGQVVKPFGRLRRTRNEADYPRLDTPQLTPADVAEDLTKAAAIVRAMGALLPHLPAW